MSSNADLMARFRNPDSSNNIQSKESPSRQHSAKTERELLEIMSSKRNFEDEDNEHIDLSLSINNSEGDQN